MASTSRRCSARSRALLVLLGLVVASTATFAYIRLLHTDTGASFNHYSADIQRNLPIDGTFTPEQRELYELGLGIRQVCLDNYRPGTTFSAVGEQVRAWLVENGHDASEDRFRGLIRWGCCRFVSGFVSGFASCRLVATAAGADGE